MNEKRSVVNPDKGSVGGDISPQGHKFSISRAQLAESVAPFHAKHPCHSFPHAPPYAYTLLNHETIPA
jgi:hypothetical protein